MIESLGGWRSKRVGRLMVGVAALVLAVGYTAEALTMPLGSRTAPGAGMFPTGVGIACAVIALVVIAETLARPVVDGDVEIPRGTQRRLVLVFAAATTALVVLIPFLGQYLSASLYAAVMIKVLSPHGWLRSGAYGIATGVAISWVFVEGFSLRLPEGVLGGLLPW